MKIVTIIRQVPDAEARVRVDNGQVALSGAAWVLDGMDEYGVEQALRLRDEGHEVEILALALGPAGTEDALRTALAMGADRAHLLETDLSLDVLATAQSLASVIQREQADLVFVGGKQADWDSAALGAALAELLGWSFSDWTTSFTVNGQDLTVRHDSDAGSETLHLSLPSVISTQQGLNDPRYPTLPNIMKAKRKELTREPITSQDSKTEVVGRDLEQREREGRILQGDATQAAQELASMLKEVGR